MRHELEELGRPVNVVAINAASAVDDQEELVKRSSFPLLQDSAEIGAWDLHSGKKDDIFIYDADGKLLHHLPVSGDVNTNLSQPDGYAAVKALLLEATAP